MTKNIRWKTKLEERSSGDFSDYIGGAGRGAPGFQGGPFGFGGGKQLANYEPDPDLFDPNEDPVLFNTYDGDYDDHPHLLPHEDETLRKLLYGDTEDDPRGPNLQQHENVIDDPGGKSRRDGFGFPRMNTLSNKKEFIPDDMDQDRDFPEPNKDNLRADLIPTGKDDSKPEYFGYGTLDANDDDKMIPQGRFEEMKVGSQNPSTNDWKSTTADNRGKIERNINYAQLVEPEDFVEELPGNQDEEDFIHLDDPEDVNNLPGSMGVLVAPQRHAPRGDEVVEGKKTDEVEDMLDSLSPSTRKSAGGKTLIGGEDFTVVLERAVKKAVKDALLEKSPPGTTAKQKKTMEAEKKAIEASGKSKKDAAAIVFGKAWNKHNAKKKR